jgi:HEAT repeat protein
MRKHSVGGAFLLGGLAIAIAGDAQAQARPPGRGPLPQPSSSALAAAQAPNASRPPADLRGRFGTDVAARLMRSSDADERLRGIERAGTTHTPEALTLLERAAGPGTPGGLDPRIPLEGIARSDPRALLAVVRALTAWMDRPSARDALAGILAAPAPSFATRAASAVSRDPAGEEAEGAARIALARQEAALALAESGNPLAIEALIAIGRSGGPGQAPALEALSIHPPSAPLVLGGVALTTPATIALAIDVGDLRALDAVLGAVRTSDPALRATAIAALGAAGDTRGIEVARAAARDPDPRVRLAAADALVRLGAPDAPQTVEALVMDDATVLGALHLAQDAQGEGVTRAAAARAAVSADRATQAGAMSALGHQSSASAVRALATLVAHPSLQGDAAYALARSPCPEALRAIEAMGSTQATRRVAARAYFVRRYVRGDRSARLDALLGALAASSDGLDRAVGVQALVALDERPLESVLGDADARVRRAAAMGALGRWDTHQSEALLARMAAEPDDTTRYVLALGLLGGDPHGAVATSALIERAGEGGPDAPLAALALAQRADGPLGGKVDALLASPDPLLRAHAARGLGASSAPDAVGRLAQAYAWEAHPEVRRAILVALAARRLDDASPARRQTLALAARLDPDGVARWTAQRAIRAEALAAPAEIHEVAWVRLEPAEGAALPRGASGLLVRSDGMAVPIAFDDEGYALVPGVPPGEARLRLAPALPAYSPSAP